MSQELTNLLRSVLREELEPINKQLSNLDNRLNGVENRLNEMDSRLVGVESHLNQLDTRLVGVEGRLDNVDLKLNEIQASQQKLSQEIASSLGKYTDEIVEYVDTKTEVLNKRVYHIECELERLTRQ